MEVNLVQCGEATTKYEACNKIKILTIFVDSVVWILSAIKVYMRQEVKNSY